jgi:hypothetical protein
MPLACKYFVCYLLDGGYHATVCDFYQIERFFKVNLNNLIQTKKTLIIRKKNRLIFCIIHTLAN